MAKTSVFVTGGTGNVGVPVVQELINRDYKVVLLTRKSVIDLEGCRPVFGSLDNLVPVLAEASRCDAIIHIASARSNNRDSVLSGEVEPTGRLLEAWKNGNFVYASSQTVYGIPSGPLTEASALDPMCWYDLGKVNNEFQIQFSEPTSVRGSGVSLRMALLFGSGTRCADRQFLPMIYDQIRDGRSFLFDSEEGLASYGSSFIGERDLACAFVDALEFDVPGPYNVAGGFCTWRELIEGFDLRMGTQSKIVVRDGAIPNPGEFRLPQSRSCLETSAFKEHSVSEASQSLDDLLDNFVKRMRQRG